MAEAHSGQSEAILIEDAETPSVDCAGLDDETIDPVEANTDFDEDISMTEPVFVFQGLPEGECDERSLYFIQKHGLAVAVPEVTRRWEYTTYEEPTAEEVLDEYNDENGVTYLVRLNDGTEEVVRVSRSVPPLCYLDS